MIRGITIPDAWRDIISQMQERFEREIESNDRIKWLFAVGVLTLYFSLLLYLGGKANDAEEKFVRSQTRLHQLEAQIQDKGWAERAASAADIRDRLRNKFWTGDTPGLAEAGFERWIRQTMELHGVDIRQVQLTRSPVLDNQIEAEASELASVEVIRAKAIGSLNETGIIKFLSDASSHDSWVIVEQFIARGGRSDRFEIDITTFYRPQQQDRE